MSGPIGAEGHWPRLDKLVLQDQRDHVAGGSELVPHLRAVPHATRVVAREAMTGLLIEQGKAGDPTKGESAQGDLGLGSVLWPAESKDKRGVPAWFFAAPAVTVEPSRDLRPPTPVEDDGTTTRDQGAPLPGTVAKPRRAQAAQRVRVRPIGDVDHSPDTRFRAIDAALAPNASPLPRGWPGVMLSATRETEQLELFLPAGDGKLVAVNHAGDPATASIVYDEDATGAIDPDRKARLHSLVRVARMAPDVGALAWQLTTSGRDGLEGHGLTVDRGSSRGPVLPDPSTGQALPPAPAPAPGRVSTPGGTAPVGQVGAVTTEDELVARGSPEPRDGQYGGAVVIGDAPPETTRVRGTTEDDPPATTSRDGAPPPDAPPGTEVQGLVYAYASARRGGHHEVGHHDDKHRLGLTLDGEPINPDHVARDFFLYADRDRDAPIEDDGKPYSRPAPAPYRVRAFLRHDAEADHPFNGERRRGLWRLEAESFLRAVPIGDPPPRRPPPPRLPPPPPVGDPPPRLRADPPPIVLDPTGQSGIGGYAPGGLVLEPTGTVRGDPLDGLPEGTLVVDGVPVLEGFDALDTGVDPETHGARADPLAPRDEDGLLVPGGVPQQGMGPASRPGTIAATSQHLQLGGGLSQTATPIGRGVMDLSTALGTAFGGLTPTQQRCIDGAPVVARSFAYGENPAGQWCHWRYATKPALGRQGTAAGGVVEHGPEVTPQQVMDGTVPVGTPKLVRVMPPGAAALAHATPSQRTGEVVNGFLEDAAIGGGTVRRKHRNGSGTVGKGVAQTSAGRFATIDASDVEKTALTPDGGVTMTEQSAPATPSSGGMEWYPKTDGKPYVKNDAGTETDLTATGGGGSGSGGGSVPGMYQVDGSYSVAGETIRDTLWGAWGPARIDGAFTFSRFNIDTTASGGRTFTFASTFATRSAFGGIGTLTASSGSFITDGWAVGDQVRITGTTSNNFDGIIVALTATVMTIQRPGGVLVAEGPLGATARIRDRIIPYIARDDFSRYRTSWVMGCDLADGSFDVLWDGGITVPDTFLSFGPAGISIDVRVRGISTAYVVGAFSSSTDFDVTFYVLDPADGTTEIPVVVNYSASDTDYVTLTIDPADLTSVQAGDVLRVGFRVDNVTYGGTGTSRMEARLTNLRPDFSGT